MTTGALWDETYMWWDTRSAGASIPAGGWIEPDEHAENPRTKRRPKNLLDASGLSKQLHWLDARPATVEELCRVHDEAYVRRMQELSDGGDDGCPRTGAGRPAGRVRRRPRDAGPGCAGHRGGWTIPSTDGVRSALRGPVKESR